MRMWMVDPKLLCRKHLLGEHAECHMLDAAIRDGKSLAGYVRKRIIEPREIYGRHARLAAEMRERGYDHASPLMRPELGYLDAETRLCRVDRDESERELSRRCPDCRARINEMRRIMH